jgi:hypothetical protein
MRATSIFLLALFLAGARPGFSQASAAEAAAAASVAQLTRQYAAAFPNYQPLFNGAEYYDYSKRFHLAAGHQYYIWPEWQNSSVVYNNLAFDGLTLSYDIVLDQLVLRQQQMPLSFRLANEHVRRFTIGEHRFERMEADSAGGGLPRTGYYEVLLDSTVALLARHTKSIHKRISQPYVDVDFLSADRLFVRRAGRYYEVDDRKSVLLAFADRAPEVQKYMQKNHLSFRENRRTADILQTVRYYNRLPAQ